MPEAEKYVYRFGAGKADGSAEMRNLLGGKGANLAEMSNLGLPVPPGFTITTEVCIAYYAAGKKTAGRAARRRWKMLSPISRKCRRRGSEMRKIRCWFRCGPAAAHRCRA